MIKRSMSQSNQFALQANLSECKPPGRASLLIVVFLVCKAESRTERGFSKCVRSVSSGLRIFFLVLSRICKPETVFLVDWESRAELD